MLCYPENWRASGHGLTERGDTQRISHSAEVTSEQCACSLQEKSCEMEKPSFSFPFNVKSPQQVSLSEQDIPQILTYQRMRLMINFNNNRIQDNIVCIRYAEYSIIHISFPSPHNN